MLPEVVMDDTQNSPLPPTLDASAMLGPVTVRVVRYAELELVVA